MKTYGYRKPVRQKRSGLKHYLITTLTVALLLAGLAVSINMYYSWQEKNNKLPQTAVRSQQVVNSKKTFKNGFFQFTDYGKWVHNQDESTSNKMVYYKYRGVLVEHQITVYINKVPEPAELAVSRVLPVRVVNGNSLDAAGVSATCDKFYDSVQRTQIKQVLVGGANIMCDPNSTDYSVILSEIGGDWIINLRRFSGANIQFAVIYRNLTANPEPYTIKNVAASFQAL